MITESDLMTRNMMRPTTPIRGVNHLALVTRDMDATIRFYRDVLGLPLIGAIRVEEFHTDYEWGNRVGARHYFFSLGNGDTLAFFEFDHVPEQLRVGALHHVAFHVPTPEDLQALRQRLLDHQVEVTEIIRRPFLQSIYFKDVNGIQLEVATFMRPWEEGVWVEDPDPAPAVNSSP